MTFDEVWKQVADLKLLQYGEVMNLPQVLSDETKGVLAYKTPQEVAAVISVAMYEIYSGSVKSVDELVKVLL